MTLSGAMARMALALKSTTAVALSPNTAHRRCARSGRQWVKRGEIVGYVGMVAAPPGRTSTTKYASAACQLTPCAIFWSRPDHFRLFVLHVRSARKPINGLRPRAKAMGKMRHMRYYQKTPDWPLSAAFHMLRHAGARGGFCQNMPGSGTAFLRLSAMICALSSLMNAGVT